MVGPYVSVAPKVTIRDAIVRDSIIDEGATISAAQLEHALVGRKAEITGRARSMNVGDTSVVML